MPIEWNSDFSDVPKHTELVAYRPDAGVFWAIYTSCESFPMPDAEIEVLGEDYFTEDWWAFMSDGVCRLEDDLVPTHWAPIEPPEDTQG